MISIREVIEKDGKKTNREVGITFDESLAKKRVARMGGYAIHIPTKKLVAQSLVPNGPKFVSGRVCVASGEDVEV
jgi:hypothetical protein